MNQLLRLGAGLFVAVSLAGCCYSPGYYDPVSGVMYGGGLQPCHLPHPFGLFGIPPCGAYGCWWGSSPGWTAPGCCNVCGNAVSGYYHDSVTSTSCPTCGAASSLPMVPAGVYDGTSEPVPNGATSLPESSIPLPAPPTTWTVPPGIFGQPARLPSSTAIPTQNDRAAKWLPARL